MANSKIIFGNETLLDLTSDTVTPADVKRGVTFHLKSGTASSGTLDGAYVDGTTLVLPNSTVSGTTVNVGE